jgi:ABC-2 type transport system permease protein
VIHLTELNKKDDLRQSRVVMKYEFRKHLEGKKILLFGGLIAAVLLLLTVLPYVFGDGLPEDASKLGSLYLMFGSLIVLIAATLFTSGAIASEFEERTALILFTKPIRKWSIYLGKYVASCLLGIVFMVVYYAIVTAVSLAVTGSIPPHFAASLGLTVLYVLSTSGIAMMISSFAKKSSTAAILTFITLLLLISIVTGVLTMYNVDTWFMLDDASNHISTCITGESGTGAAAGIMGIWALITTALGYFIFKKREF